MAAALVIAGAVAFSVARPAAATPTTIWGDSKPTGVYLDQDKSGVELGTSVTPAVDGQVKAIRFYKLTGQSGIHTGSIWAPDGTRMATVTFTNESAEGWQTAALTTPVALKSGASYVVSYRVPAGGRYAATVDFSGKSTSAILAVPPRDSGVFTYAASGAHPSSTWRSSQYWADIIFVPGALRDSGGSSTPTPTTTAAPTSATPTPTPTPTTAAVTPQPTQPKAVAPPPAAPPAPGTPPSSTTGFPTRASAGLPSGWQPTTQVTGDYYIRQAGAVVQDLRITDGTIIIEAANVTLRRIQFVGSALLNGLGSTCYSGLLIEDSEFTPNGPTSDSDNPVIQYGGYTARNIVIDGVPEGLRVGGSDINCGPVSVFDSFIRVTSPTTCTNAWHGDGIQGYGGNKVIVRNTTIFMQVVNDCYGTAPFFYPKNQDNTAVDIDGLLIGGSSGYPFRSGMPGPIKNLNIVDGSWVYAPVDVNCSVVTTFQARVVTLDSGGQPVGAGRPIECAGQGN